MTDQPGEEPLPKEGELSDEERERIVDDAAMRFAQLFLDQCMYKRRSKENPESTDGDQGFSVTDPKNQQESSLD